MRYQGKHHHYLYRFLKKSNSSQNVLATPLISLQWNGVGYCLRKCDCCLRLHACVRDIHQTSSYMHTCTYTHNYKHAHTHMHTLPEHLFHHVISPLPWHLSVSAAWRVQPRLRARPRVEQPGRVRGDDASPAVSPPLRVRRPDAVAGGAAGGAPRWPRRRPVSRVLRRLLPRVLPERAAPVAVRLWPAPSAGELRATILSCFSAVTRWLTFVTVTLVRVSQWQWSVLVRVSQWSVLVRVCYSAVTRWRACVPVTVVRVGPCVSVTMVRVCYSAVARWRACVPVTVVRVGPRVTVRWRGDGPVSQWQWSVLVRVLQCGDEVTGLCPSDSGPCWSLCVTVRWRGDGPAGRGPLVPLTAPQSPRQPAAWPAWPRHPLPPPARPHRHRSAPWRRTATALLGGDRASNRDRRPAGETAAARGEGKGQLDSIIKSCVTP